MKTLLQLIISFFIYISILACTCIGEGSVESEYKKSDLVVIGEVINVKTIKIWSDTSFAIRNYHVETDTFSLEQNKLKEELYSIRMQEFTIIVDTSFKGSHPNDTLKIWTGIGDGDCGFPFMIQKKYLIYAQAEYKINYIEKKLGRTKEELEGIYRTDICRRTALLEDSKADLKYLLEK